MTKTELLVLLIVGGIFLILPLPGIIELPIVITIGYGLGRWRRHFINKGTA